MHDQQRTLNPLTVLLIIKGLLQHQTRTPAVQILGYFLQRNKRTQKDSAVYRVLLCNGETYGTANGPSEHYNLVTCKFIGMKELHESCGVSFYVFGRSLSLVNAITSILHG